MNEMNYSDLIIEACLIANAAFDMNDASSVVNALTEVDALNFLMNDA